MRGKGIPTETRWWQRYKPALISGLDARAAGLAQGPAEVVLFKQQKVFEPIIKKIIDLADDQIRRQNAESSTGNP